MMGTRDELESSRCVDWSFLLPLSGTRAVGRPQASYKLDNSLVFPLSQLPLSATRLRPYPLADATSCAASSSAYHPARTWRAPSASRLCGTTRSHRQGFR